MGSQVPSRLKFKFPPIDLQGSPDTQIIRSVPELIDYNARVNPDFIFCYQAVKAVDGKDGGYEEGNSEGATVSITMRQLQGVVAQCSRRLLSEIPDLRVPIVDLDGTVTKSPAVALLLESDLTLLIHLFSLLALGIPVAILSARLSSVAVAHLLKETGAKHVIVSTKLSKSVHLDASPEVQVHTAKHFQQDLALADRTASATFTTICVPNHYISDSDRQVLILHSSGTTGLPKAIYQSHKYFLGFTTCHSRTDVEIIDGLNVSSLPFYHGFGLVAPCLSLGIGKPLWIPPSHTLPTGASISRAIREVDAKSLMTVPHILEEICGLPENEGIASLLPLQFVGCGGGPLKYAVGEKLSAKGVKLLAHFGTTETGPLAPFFVPSQDYDWRFWRLRNDYDITVEPVTRDTIDNLAQYKLTIRPFGWSTNFVLQDRLIASKQSGARDFQAVGRKDDLIILNTGEKVSPKILESLLCNSELVKAAVVFGDGQFELGVIVEPAVPLGDLEEFKSNIWPVIEEAGRQMDNHAQISSMAGIIVTPPGRSFPRSDKGSVLRKEVYCLYDSEIQQAYKTMEESAADTLTKSLDFESLEQSLKEIIEGIIFDNLSTDGLEFTQDVFELGVNSLQAARIRRALQASLTKEKLSNKLSIDFIYRNPSIRRMARALQNMAPCHSQSDSDESLSEEYIQRYSLSPKNLKNSGHTILLTGANGSLGSHMLKHLIEMPSVTKIICLGRVTGSTFNQPLVESTHLDPFKEAKLLNRHNAEVVRLRGDPNRPQFALQDDVYSALCSSVTHILHAAWPMDFQQLLPSFQTQFRFLQNLLQLCRDSHHLRPFSRPRLVFISSIAVVGQYCQSHDSALVPEIPMKNMSSTNDFGYGKAKYVCEKIIENAAERNHDEMEVNLVRVGQISGSTESGFWNSKEHFPAIVRLSQAVKKYPRTEGTLSWLPVDIAASALSEILLSESRLDLVYHLENPVRQSFDSVISHVATNLGQPDESPALVTLDEWQEAVLEYVAANPDKEDIAVDELLLEFLKNDFKRMSSGSIVLDTCKTQKISRTLRNATEVSGEVITKYVQAWRQAGVLQ